MKEYTYDNLIVNPNQEGIESLIGKEVYYSDIPLYCIRSANENYKIGILREVRNDEAAPFYIENPVGCALNYACIIPKKEEPKPKYVPFKNITEFLDAHRSAPGCLNEEASYLSKKGIWLTDKASESYYMVTRIGDIGVFIVDDSGGIIPWDELLEYYTFLDGTPCGKLEENK